MSSAKTYVIFTIIFLPCVIGTKIAKSSLTFVIDDTGSMSEEISQVKDSVNSIFDTVISYENSQIQNFILVTFNDPGALLLTTTEDRDEFRNALASIHVNGGGDCPEYAMKGIKIALENSLPRSLLYVFTDAAAKDYAKFDEIRSLAQKKSIQITFLLTGECSGRSEPAYRVYHQIAEATDGEVFNMMKREIKEILDYVKQNIKGNSDVLISEKLPSGYGHKLNITVDSKTTDVVISATGLKPKISVKDPEGKDAPFKPIVDLEEAKIVKLTEPKPGVHTADIGSMSGTSVKVRGTTTVSFQHGFSTFEPTSLEDTATRPPPDGNAYLSIKLQGDGVKLESAKILDMDDKIVTILPLKLVDEKTKFYVTAPFNPPNTTFRIAVYGFDEENKLPIKRVTATPIERQNPKYEKVDNVAPAVTIEGGPRLVTDYNTKLQLKCKVHGYPKPDITWQEKNTGVILPATVSTIEVPYDYISILNIDKTHKNVTYECKATSPLGVNINYIDIVIPEYFNIVTVPKKIISVEYDNEKSLVCNIKAVPPATITWFKDGLVLVEDDNIKICENMTTVTIKHMKLETQGRFICEARNDFHRKLFPSYVLVHGLVKPNINKTDEKIYVLKGNDVQLTCQIIEGIPKPTIQWYFQRRNEEKFTELTESGEVLYLNHVSLDDVGTYKCNASNVVGSEIYAMDLIVEYPPTIKDDKVRIRRAKDGDKVTLPCEVDAVPKASVKWIKDESSLERKKTVHMNRNHSLKFREISIADTGYYTCVVSNKYGTSKKTVYVDVIVAVHIEVPKVSTIETMVGRNLPLACNADGYPKPEIIWIYNDFDRKIHQKKLRANIASTSLGLQKLQVRDQGFYTCIASNVGGSSNITYAVKVNAPPVIENIYPDKTFRTVKGDVALKIHCRVTGNPTPTIIWKKNDLNIASGSEWYDIDNGTLLVKNLDEKSQGSYLCVAENKIGTDTIVYDVIVNDYPVPGLYVPTKFVENEKTAHIKCDIPHKKTDSLRWYKDHKLIAEGELFLYNIRRGDDGIYSCRVSNSTKSISEHVNVVVGYKPFFVSEESEDVDFILGDFVPLICETRGEPELKVSWTLNGEKLDVREMIYDLEMMMDNRGTYTCTISNEIGSIQRNFNIISQDCILDTKRDFLNDKQPLMLSSSLTWPIFDIVDNYMIVLKNELFYLHCRNGFTKFSSQYVTAFCEGGSKIKINGNVYEYSDIKCKKNTELTVERTGKNCLPGNTESIEVGYKVFTRFLNVYEVCLDKDNNVPIYTKHELSPNQYGVTNNLTEWSRHGLPPIDFDSVYDCTNQAGDISSALGTVGASCCYGRRQLVNPKDLRPGIPEAVAYTYLNVVPQWSTCNSQNWADLEERVGVLAEQLDHDLTVITGVAKRRRNETHSNNIVLHDNRGRKQPVAQYLWKVVQDPLSSKSLAIIQVNVPNLRTEDTSSYVHCEDICHAIEWMNGTDWHSVEDGYTYCCSILSFESAFNFYRQFSRDKTAILDFVVTPEYTYSI